MKLKHIKYLANGLTSFFIASAYFGARLIEPRLIDFGNETAIIPNLPAEFEGKRIALIADFPPNAAPLALAGHTPGSYFFYSAKRQKVN